MDIEGARWKKSARSSGGSSNCVELADLGERLAVRDSKSPDTGVLVLGGQARAAFLRTVKNGTFDV